MQSQQRSIFGFYRLRKLRRVDWLKVKSRDLTSFIDWLNNDHMILLCQFDWLIPIFFKRQLVVVAVLLYSDWSTFRKTFQSPQ